MLSTLSSIVVRPVRPSIIGKHAVFRRFFASSVSDNSTVRPIAGGPASGSSDTNSPGSTPNNSIRLSKFLSHDATNLALSRRQAERLIREGEVTLAGNVVQTPHFLLDFDEIIESSANKRPMIKLSGKPVLIDPSFTGSQTIQNDNRHETFLIPRVWAVHKVKGEVVTENDPHGRPSLLERLKRSGVGRSKQAGKRKRQQRQIHLKPIGRLDMPTEGLILVTNDGGFAREMELPSSKIHRVYRVRVHGRLTSYKLDRIRKGGIEFDDVRYPSMKVEVEKPRRARSTSSNTWLRVTCTEGKNRQIRNVFASLGVSVTRLIRVAYGDYKLETIPPGLALPVPYKPVTQQKARGPLGSQIPKKKTTKRTEQVASPVKWVTSIQ